MSDLLIELLSEEIPARMQKKASDDLKEMMSAALKEAGLTFEIAEAFATPRRLALTISGIPDKTPDISEERRGPRTDAPEKALEGFMRGAGVTRDQLEEREEAKGTFFYALIEKPGRATTEVIAEALEATVRNFPWPKSQRWGDGSLKWVRPLQSILCLFGSDVVEMEIDGIKAGNTTRGHRFMAPATFAVTDFADYRTKLQDAKVVLDPAMRMAKIAEAAKTLADKQGVEWVEDKGLLAEVAGLVEWPVPLLGSFDPSFMEVPEEVLILTMKKDQKYFVTRDRETGKLAPHFITVSNLEAKDGGAAVATGNGRVIAARLADAKFFWEQDLKGKLEDNLPQLQDIVFHIELGRMSDRVARMKALAGFLAEYIDGCDPAEAERAAELAKADLVSGMVYEFPEVQGIMGRYYAKAQGESDAVADAIRDHYAPAGPSDDCPSAPVSVAVALAEKLDTLVGFFGIDQKPTGSKDPYALRRAALGLIRLITENKMKMPLAEIITQAVEVCFEVVRARGDKVLWIKDGFVQDARRFSNEGVPVEFSLGAEIKAGDDILAQESSVCFLQHDGDIYSDAFVAEGFCLFEPPRVVLTNLLEFFADRLKVQQRDLGVRHDLIDAVFAKGDDDLVRILNRVSALSSFLESDDGSNLLAGYKRAANILKIEEKKDGKSYDQDVLEAALVDPEEEALAVALTRAAADAEHALAAEDFEKAMAALSTLRAPIDAFFDKVTVNADDEALRANRLALLSQIRAAVNTVADFSLIEG